MFLLAKISYGGQSFRKIVFCLSFNDAKISLISCMCCSKFDTIVPFASIIIILWPLSRVLKCLCRALIGWMSVVTTLCGTLWRPLVKRIVFACARVCEEHSSSKVPHFFTFGGGGNGR